MKSVQWTVFPPNKCARMLPADMKRLRKLEDENSRLKRIVADLALDKEMASRCTCKLHAIGSDLWRRERSNELLHHSDQGSQYTSEPIQKLMVDNGVTWMTGCTTTTTSACIWAKSVAAEQPSKL